VEKESHFEQSRALYETAIVKDTDKADVFKRWAISFTWQGNYGQAWGKVPKEVEFGGMLRENVLSELLAKIPEPQN
jgi:hypothetical protein